MRDRGVSITSIADLIQVPANGYVVLFEGKIVAQDIKLAKFTIALFQRCQGDNAMSDAVILVCSLQDESVPELGIVEALKSDIRLLSEVSKRTLLLQSNR